MMSARRCGPLGLADQLEMWMALDRQQLWQRFEGSQHLLPPTRPFRTPSADHFIHHVAVIFKNPENLIRLAEFEIKWCLIMWIIFDHHVISTLKRINFSFAGIETLSIIFRTTSHSLLYLCRRASMSTVWFYRCRPGYEGQVLRNVFFAQWMWLAQLQLRDALCKSLPTVVLPVYCATVRSRSFYFYYYY